MNTMNNPTAIILDDEKLCRIEVENLLHQYYPDFKILLTTGNEDEAVEYLRHTRPSVLFLDVMLAGCSAFELLETLPNLNFDIIFFSSYNKYAIRAFEFSAINYLEKPISEMRFKQAMQRLLDKNSSNSKLLRNQTLLENYQQQNFYLLQPVNGDRYIKVTLQEISRFEANGSYTKPIVATSSHDFLISKNLGEIADLIEANTNFIRIGRSVIINLSFVKEVVYPHVEVIMLDKSSFIVTELYMKEFKQRFRKL